MGLMSERYGVSTFSARGIRYFFVSGETVARYSLLRFCISSVNVGMISNMKQMSL